MISNRLLKLHEYVFNESLSELTTKVCDFCNRFRAPCCPFDSPTSHRLMLVFTDGACLNNGKRATDEPGAGAKGGSSSLTKAGIGAAAGRAKSERRSKPVNDTLDPGMPRTNQRAELLGALEGLDLLLALWKEESERERARERGQGNQSDRHGSTDNSDDGPQKWVVATDSEYVVKGITQWYPTWEKRNWRTADGKTPTNLDLFHHLNDNLTAIEALNIQVGFWRIPREYNKIADGLAKEAALRA
ncbi:ribonuclease H-like protein [Dendrothele bispora CBS 962.96]|uniref:ribonuclease H n=1 Tax=Dendrothele bispora (strain CBS 962.96) TaxID=1314807 RepID=A0A4S8LDK2_DENBC|nr:ribonuclease H-like protein [Dendrothele bispora CBS 962.96]